MRSPRAYPLVVRLLAVLVAAGVTSVALGLTVIVVGAHLFVDPEETIGAGAHMLVAGLVVAAVTYVAGLAVGARIAVEPGMRLPTFLFLFAFSYGLPMIVAVHGNGLKADLAGELLPHVTVAAVIVAVVALVRRSAATRRRRATMR